MIPIISGTVAGQTVDGGTIAPFANANTSDANPGPDHVSDTLTISLLGSDGNATDANGTLSSGADTGNTTFAEISPGVYSLSVSNPASETVPNTDTLNAQLHNLTFTPSGAATTTFSVYVTDKYAGEQSTDSTTSVIASGGSTPATPATDVAPVATSGNTTVTPAAPATGDTATVTANDSATTPAGDTIAATTGTNTMTPATPQFTQSATSNNGSAGTVLTASSGQSFLIGETTGGGLMIDGKDPGSSDWSAISGLNPGDSVTIVGVSPSDFSIGAADGQRAAGFVGNTLDASTSGTPATSAGSASAKVAGLMNGNDVKLFGGKVTASFGSGSDGTSLLTLHA